ncbi:MAG: hypothetical protein RLW62_04025, partial [Gammaproteobacteria bacterium]
MNEKSREPGSGIATDNAALPDSLSPAARRAVDVSARQDADGEFPTSPMMSYEDLSSAIARSLSAFDAVDENGRIIYVNEAYL